MNLPDNLTIYSRQEDVVPFYNEASIVLNLSDKKQFVETFGMTALEAMSAGLPVIVPTVGGIAEQVEDGVNGYKIDVQHIEEIRERIEEVLSHPEQYKKLSKQALAISSRCDTDEMADDIAAVIS